MNKVVLSGRLTKDAELNYAAGSGTAICRFSLAVQRPFKREETDFINCISFGKTAEIIAQYFTKGKPILIEGHIQTGSYEKDGVKRYTTDIVVSSFEFMGSNGQSKDNAANEGFEEMEPIFEDSPF